MTTDLSKKSIPSWLKTVLKLIVSVLILWLVIRKIEPQQLLHSLQEVHPVWWLWAFVWFTISKLISAVRFRALLETEGVQLGAGANLRLYWLGMYYNLLLPGGISGDGYKIKVLMDAFAKPFRSLFFITVVDRFSGLFALGQVSLLLVPFIPALEPFAAAAWILLALSFGVLLLGYRFFPKAGASLMSKTTVYSLAVQLAQTVAVVGLIWALQEQAQWAAYLLLFLVSSVAAMLPLTIGGAGAREFTFLYGASWLSLHTEKAVAIAFVFYIVSTLVALTGMIYSFKKIDLQ